MGGSTRVEEPVVGGGLIQVDGAEGGGQGLLITAAGETAGVWTPGAQG